MAFLVFGVGVTIMNCSLTQMHIGQHVKFMEKDILMQYERFSYIYGADIGCSLFCEWYIWRTSWQSATEKTF